MKLFEYAIIYTPKDKSGKALILKQPTTVLAETQASVNLLAAREIPKMYVEFIDEVQVVVRPF